MLEVTLINWSMYCCSGRRKERREVEQSGQRCGNSRSRLPSFPSCCCRCCFAGACDEE